MYKNSDESITKSSNTWLCSFMHEQLNIHTRSNKESMLYIQISSLAQKLKIV